MSIDQTHGSRHLGRREWVQAQLVGGGPGGDCMEEIKPKLVSKDPGAVQSLPKIITFHLNPAQRTLLRHSYF
jgi:hypothetical protein